MINHIIYAGKSSIDFGITISGEGTFNTPRRRYTEVVVPGRSGALLIDEGAFDNIEVKYPALIKDDMPARWKEFINFAASMPGYQRLEDTYNPYEYRMAQINTETVMETAGYNNCSGLFDIVFNCKPQRFLKSGEQAVTYTSNGTIYNRTCWGSTPLLNIYGTSGTVQIGGTDITLSTISTYVTVDCETMDAYKGATNCNQNVTFSTDKVAIPAGESLVTLSGNITRVEVTPRWYII